MTDKEKDKTEKEYKEWLAHDHKLLENPTYYDIEQKCFRAFFAGTRYGLAEGRKEGYEQGYEDCRHYAHDYYKPKWHDLRKNPEDLPKETGHYLTDDGEYIYDADLKEWRTLTCMVCWDFHWLDDGDVIAWTELPKFEE